MSYEKLEKLVNEKTEIYFEKYFANKSPEEFLFDISKNYMTTLGRVYTKFLVIRTCLLRVVENNEYIDTLNSKTKEQINDTIEGIEEICRCLKEIIETILDGIEA